MEADDSFIHRLPKAELHVHLDGSLRAATMFELAEQRGVELPGSTPEALESHMVVQDATSLEEYLERFELTLAVMQDTDALERIAYELVLDNAAENVRWVEVRFCPQLNRRQGLALDEVLDAALRGMRRAGKDVGTAGGSIDSAIIVCGLRSHEARVTSETAEIAVDYAQLGVCGFDLAGAEAGYPASDHQDALDRAHAGGLPITLHAGEGFGPESIRQALDLGHARRIGHGTRLHEDQALLDRVREEQIPLEVCLTSNVQTGVVPSLAEHPAHRYLRAGVPISLATDNRLMSGVTLTDEYRNAQDALGMSRAELVAVARAGFQHAFADEHTRKGMLASFDEANREVVPVTPSAADLARGWIEAWIRMDMEWLRDHLAPDFVHTSPFGRLEGRDDYLATVEPMARKSVQNLEIKDVVAADTRAAVWFENRTPAGVTPTYWVFVEDGLISRVRSFYDASAVSAVLSEGEQEELRRQLVPEDDYPAASISSAMSTNSLEPM